MIDLHNHEAKSDSSLQLINVFAQDLPLPSDEHIYSIGLHPWHLELVDNEHCLQLMEQAMDQKNILAIGECGIDKAITTGFAWQERYFIKQAELAEKYSKPLIIHCVRAFYDLIRLKKKIKASVPWIIHGFQGNEKILSALIQHDFYFSVSKHILTNPHKKDILPLVPVDHLFFETDNHDLSISEIYALASKILNTDEETLEAIIAKNFKRLFEWPSS